MNGLDKQLFSEAERDQDRRLIDHLGMAVGGATLATGVLFGLRSFGGRSQLFGEIGRAMGEPEQAVLRMLDRMRGIFRSGDVSMGDTAKAALYNKLSDEEGEKALRRMAQRMAQSEELTSGLTEALVRGQESAQLEDAKEQIQNRAKKAAKLTREATTKLDANHFKRYLKSALQDENHPFWKSMSDVEGPASTRLTKAVHLFGHLGPEDLNPVEMMNRIHEKRGVGQRFGEDTASEARRAFRRVLQNDPMAFLQEVPLENAHPGALEALRRRAELGTLPDGRPLPIGGPDYRSHMEMAWEQYVFENPNRDLDRNLSVEQIEERMKKDKDLAAIYEQQTRGTVGKKQRFRPQQASQFAPSPRYNYLAAQHLAPEGAEKLVAKKLGLDDISTLYDDSVVEDMTWQLSNELDYIQEEINKERGGSNKVRIRSRIRTVGEDHRAIELLFREGDQQEKAVIPIRSGSGTYMDTPQSRPFEAGMKYTHNPHLMQRMGRNVVRPEEMVLNEVMELSHKFMSDFQDGRGPKAAERLVRRIRRKHFRSKDYAKDAPLDTMRHASNVAIREMDVFERIQNSRTEWSKLQRNVEHARRLKQVMETGSTYFAGDIEFWSRQQAQGYGMQHVEAARSELPYQISGSVMQADPSSGKSDALISIDYKARLFEEMDEESRQALFEKNTNHYRDQIATQLKDGKTKGLTFQDEVLAGIHSFQKQHLSGSELNDLFRTMEEGELTLRAGGATMRYDMTKNEFVGETGKDIFSGVRGMKWRQSAESFEAFSTRVMTRVLDDQGVQFSAGHNFEQADAPQLRALAKKHGMAVPKAFQADRLVDTYKAGQAMHMEGGPSLSQENMVGRMFGLSRREFGEVQDAVVKGSAQNLQGAQRQAAGVLHQIRQSTGGGALHSANVDAMMTGRILMPGLYQKMQNPQYQEILGRAERMLDATGRATGQVQFVGNEYGDLYGNQDDEGNLNYAFGTQSGVSMGEASLLRSAILPFHGILNPERQRYQDLKQKLFLYKDAVRDTGSRTPVAGSSVFGTSGGAIQSRIYEGFAQHTRLFDDAVGKMQSRMGVTALTAFLPEQIQEVWESQTVVAQPLMQRIGGPRNVQSLNLEVDYDALRERITTKGTDGQTPFQRVVERDRKNYMSFSAEERAARTPSGHSAWTERMMVYKNIAMLEELQKEATGEGEKVIRRALREAEMQLQGNLDQDDMVREAYDDLRNRNMDNLIQGKGVTATGETGADGEVIQRGRTPLFRRGDLTFGEVLSPHGGAKNSPLAPVSLRFDHEQGKVRMDYVTDPRGKAKKTYGPTRFAKVTISGVEAQNEVIPGSGIQATPGAMFWKAKRRELGSMVQVQIGRVQTMANQQIQLLMQQGMDRQAAADKAKRVLKNALRKLGVTNPSEIDRAIEVVHDYGEPRLKIRYTEPMMQQIQEKGSTLRFMDMAKESGLSFEYVHKRAISMLENSGVSEKEKRRLQTEITDTMKRQAERELSSYEERLRKLQAEGADLDKVGQVQNVIDRYRKALREGVERSREGFLFDVLAHTNQQKEEDMFASTAFLLDSTQSVIEHSVYSKTSMEQVFTSGTGRITKKKRTSALDATLLSRSLSERAGGSQQHLIRSITDAWLGSNAGAVKISDQKMRSEVIDALYNLKNKHGIKTSISELAQNVERTSDGFIVRHLGERMKLDVSPYALKRTTTKAHASLASMLTGKSPAELGYRVGGSDVGNVFELNEQTMDEALYGVSQQDRRSANAAVTGSDQADASAVYVGRGDPADLRKKGILSSASDNPLFRRGTDFIGFELFDESAVGSMSRSDAEKRLREMGVSEFDINMILGKKNLVEEALTDKFEGIDVGEESVEENKALRRRIRSIRGQFGADDPGLASKMYVPTLSESAVWMQKGDHMKVHLPAQLRTLYDQVAEGRFTDASNYTTEILRAAREGDQTKVERLLAMGDVRESLQLRGQAQRSAIQAAGVVALREAELEKSRFIEGQYKTSTGAMSEIKRLDELNQYVLNEDWERFNTRVKEMYYAEANADPTSDAPGLQKRVKAARDSLQTYIREQHRAGNMEAWQFKGYGVGETVIGEGVGRRVADQQDMYYKMAKNGQLDIDANLQEQMEKWGGNYFSAEAMGAEAGRTRQAVERHGSESVMMLQARQPIFQNALPASVSQAYVMADEARMVLGADPEQTAGAVHPFKMVLNQGDYDGDAEWRGTVDLPALSGALREHVAPQTARQIKNIYDALEGGDSLASMGLDASSIREQDGRISFRADRSSQTFGNSAFADSFAFAGDMQNQFGSDASGRADVAVQKSVVGTFGSFQKRSVLFAQFQGTFGNIAQMMRQQMDDPNFNAFTSDEMAEAGRIARKMERLRRQSTGVFGDAFQNLALAEAGITQDAAIEKYKGGDAARSAEDALRLMRGLYDRGGIEADATVGKVISMSEGGHSLMSHYKRAMGGDLDIAREALETRSAAIQLVDRVMNRTGMSSSYLRTYTNARTSEQALDSDPYSRSMNVATDGAGAAVDAAERTILDISQHARQASEVVSELNQMTIDAGMVGAESKGSIRQMLSGLPGGAKIGAAIGGVGALLLSSGRENVAGERGPAYQNGAPTYEAHSRQSTRRLMQARENAHRDVMRAGLQMRDIGRQYAVPPPPTQTRSY